jgi:DNA-binding SARP family transcriptional activator/tetratricopeptide (TPR) repeat protein
MWATPLRYSRSDVAVIYLLLGDLAVVAPDGNGAPLPTPLHRAVLAVLLVNANRVVASEDLRRSVWGEAEGDPTQLHKAITALRSMLDLIGRRGDLVTHARLGYEIRAPEDAIDAAIFRRLVRDADAARSDGRTDDEVALLGEALTLWRGPHALSNVSRDAVRRDVEDLEQRRKRAAVRLFDLEISRRNYDLIVDQLRPMVVHYPSDRRLCIQLMIAEYRGDHRGDALDVYERYVTALAEEMGADPDPELRRLKLAMGSDDTVVIARAEATIAPMTMNSVGQAEMDVPLQLAPPPADFVGREDLVSRARRILDSTRHRVVPVVVIPGPAGMGKTALALHVADLVRERFEDGQLFVELRGSSDAPMDPSDALALFLRGFGVPQVPESRDERLALYRTLLANRKVLVVLDDARDEAHVRDLVPANPECAVLITARPRMPDIDGAHHLPSLPPLERDAAATLFGRIVQRSGLDADAEPEATRAVVELCAGLPLALCITAALRVRDYGTPTVELAKRLARTRPQSFEYGARSVARSIATGFDHLDDDGRRLFLGLGLLRTPDLGLWAAAAILDRSSADPHDVLTQLTSTSMLQPPGPDLPCRFHDLTREYAYQRAVADLPDERERFALVERAYRALLTLARRAHRGLYGGDFEVVHSDVADVAVPVAVVEELEESPLAWFETQRRNIRAAVDHCADLGLTQMCWDLAISAHEFYTIAGYYDDWYATHTAALRACRRAGDLRGEGVVLAILGQPTLVASRSAGTSGIRDLRQAVDLLAGCGDRHGEAIALRTLANALRRQGRLGEPLALLDRALAGYEASGDTVGEWQTLRYIGQAQLRLSNIVEAIRMLQLADERAGRLNNARLTAQTKYWLGQAHLAHGDLAQARPAFDIVSAIYGSTGTGGAYAIHGFGDLARLSGDFDEAERTLNQAARLARESLDAILEGRVHLSFAAMRGVQGRIDEQLDALAKAVECFAGCGAAHLETPALAMIAEVEAASGNHEAARATAARLNDLRMAMELPDDEWPDHLSSTPA